MATVRYLVDDVDSALDFYRCIGFRLSERWGPPFAIVKRKGISLWLSGPGTSARKKLSSGEVPLPGGFNRIVIEVNDLDQSLTDLKALGFTPKAKPVKGPGGMQALVADPSGNLVELFEPVESQ